MKRWELVCDRGGGDVTVLGEWRWEFPPLLVAATRNWWVEIGLRRGRGPDRAYIVRPSPAGWERIQQMLDIREAQRKEAGRG